MIALISLDSLTTVALIGGGALYALAKTAERLGWIRTPTAWKQEAEALAHRVDELAAELKHVRGELETVKTENAELRGRPDFDVIVQMVERHEARSDEQTSAICAALERIAHHVGAAA